METKKTIEKGPRKMCFGAEFSAKIILRPIVHVNIIVNIINIINI